jgi:hypothetical protein
MIKMVKTMIKSYPGSLNTCSILWTTLGSNLALFTLNKA